MTINSTLKVVCTPSIGRSISTLQDIYIATLSSWLIAAIVSMIVIYKNTARTGLDWFSKEKIRSATNFYLSGLSHMSYSTFTLIIVGSVLSNTDVAIYSVVSRLTLITILFQQVYTSIYSVEFRFLGFFLKIFYLRVLLFIDCVNIYKFLWRYS